MNLQFYLRYHTEFGQSLWISGNLEELGNGDPERALPMEYLDSEYWTCSLEIKRKSLGKGFRYFYFLKNKDGEITRDWGNDRRFDISLKDLNELALVDTWNFAGEYENVFYTAPFEKVLLPPARGKKKAGRHKHFTHVFRVKAPLLEKNQSVCLLGNGDGLNDWDEANPIQLYKKGHWWTTRLDLSGNSFPVAYKYGIYDHKEEKLVSFESGNNRMLTSEASRKKLTILHDGFIQFPNNSWKGAGIAIPVFSLRSRKSFGVGEFTDIRLLVDWVRKAGLKLIQLLPVNDTIATNSWMDSYPYAGISAFALHPLYINLEKAAGKEFKVVIEELAGKQEELNRLPEVDYEEVIKTKLSALREIYELSFPSCFESGNYRDFFNENKNWLKPYAAFCWLRDKYGTAHFENWSENALYNKTEIDQLVNPKSEAFKEIGFFYFTQYHLHRQLKEAADYAHKKGIILKGDIPIGVYRFGVDAWTAPELFNMCWQAGAPPDDFTAVGQNWGFPTYNWKKMQEDGFDWWKQRFRQMSNYFDAFRIDHILGFFRIWSIPIHAVQGIMGRFVPCLPVHVTEFGENGIWFEHDRYCKPFITDEILNKVFGTLSAKVKKEFLAENAEGGYDLLPGFETQREVENYFDQKKDTTENQTLKLGLFDLISNVILFEEEGSDGQEFHFRISMEKTESFKNLIPHIQEKLRNLYINYFYRRQDQFWKKEAMHKLPQLKSATNMLVCGEDLGMVPHCVPEVMQELGILSLEIQRMPKDMNKEFFHPSEAPYLSVITPSTHDMSTVRGWWEENPERTRLFYNQVMGQWGDPPQHCEAWINRAIILQHLYSPAMWSIFQFQDILGMSETLRREDPREERINDPANPKHYWRYRIHLDLEDLVKQDEFNKELRGYVQHSGR
jgi:4-alpha-glucanotransferase